MISKDVQETYPNCRCGQPIGPHFCGFSQEHVLFQSRPFDSKEFCKCGALLGTLHFCGFVQNTAIEGFPNSPDDRSHVEIFQVHKNIQSHPYFNLFVGGTGHGTESAHETGYEEDDIPPENLIRSIRGSVPNYRIGDLDILMVNHQTRPLGLVLTGVPPHEVYHSGKYPWDSYLSQEEHLQGCRNALNRYKNLGWI